RSSRYLVSPREGSLVVLSPFAPRVNHSQLANLPCGVNQTNDNCMGDCLRLFRQRSRSHATYGVSPNSVSPAASATLTINTPSLSAAYVPRSSNTTKGLRAELLPVGLVGFVLLLSDSKRRGLWILCFLLIAAAILPAACGGGSSTKSVPQNYSVTVSATSGALQRSTTTSVTVN